MHLLPHTVTTHNEWLLRNRKCCLYWGSLCNLNICRFLSYYISCGALLTWVQWGYICIVPHTQFTARNNEWLLKSKMLFYTGTPMANISLIRFLSYYISCGAITWYRLRLAYMHCATHSYSSLWVVVEIENVVCWGSYVTSNISPDSISQLLHFMWCYNVVQAEVIAIGAAHTVTAHNSGC
jgi:hypothetical protein